MASNDTNAITNRLHELCELLHVSVHMPRLTRKIQQGSAVVADQESTVTLDATQATQPAWRLMPVEMTRQLAAVDNQVTKLLRQYSVSFRSRNLGGEISAARYQINGLYLVPASHAETLLSRLAELNEELRELVRSWAADPERFHAAVRQKLGDEAYALAQAQIPALGELLTATRIQTISIPFGANAEMIRETGERSFLRQARERSREMVEQVAANLIAEPRRELAEALTSLRTLIAEDGRVTARSLNPIRRAYEKLELFDFVADDDLRAQMTALRAQLDSMAPGEQNSTTSANNGLLDALRNVASTAMNETQIAAQTARVMALPGQRRMSLRPRAAHS